MAIMYLQLFVQGKVMTGVKDSDTHSYIAMFYSIEFALGYMKIEL